MAVTQTQLTELYLAYFGRPPDFDGLSYYLAQPDATVASVAANFSASPESQALYGTGSLSSLINAIYNNLFNRDAEIDGLVFWSNAINQGWITAAGAAYEILKGAQNEDAIAVANKLEVSGDFLDALDTGTEAIGYSGDDANASARAFLATIDSTTDLTAVDVDAAVAEAVGLGGVIGETYSLTEGVDTIEIEGATQIDTVTGVIDGTNDTFTVGDNIEGNGLTIVQLALAGSQDVPFSTLKDIASIELINATSAAVTFEASGWTNVGEINMDTGGAGGDAWFSNLETGVDLNISVAGGLGASYATMGAYFWNLDAGDSGAFVDGDVTLSVAEGNAASFSVYGSSDLTVGDVTVTLADSASLTNSTSLWTSGDLVVGNVSVAMGDTANLNTMWMGASGDVTVGTVTVTQGDNGADNFITISGTATGDVTVGDISLTIGSFADATTGEVGVAISADVGDVLVGNVTGSIGDSNSGLYVTAYAATGSVTVGNVSLTAGNDAGVSLSVSSSNSGDVTVGDVSLVAGTSGWADLEVYAWDSTGDVTVGDVTMSIGQSATLEVSISSTGISGTTGDGAAYALGNMTIGDLSFTLAEDATGSVSIEHYMTGTLTGTAAETIGSLTIGDIAIDLGSDATLEVSITQAMYGTQTSGTTVGDVTIGDLTANLAIGASASVSIEVSNTASGDVGAVAVGDVTVVGDDGANFSFSLDVSAQADIGSVTVGDFDVTLGVGAEAYVSVTVDASGDIGTVAIGDMDWNVGVDSTGNSGWWLGIYADGDIGSVTRGDTDVVLGTEASMTYAALSVSASGDIGSVTKGDSVWVAGAGAYISYDYLGVYADGDVGTVTQGDLDVTLGADATYTNSNYLSVTASGTVDSVSMGDITAQVGASASFAFYVYAGGTDGVGDLVVGDVTLTSEGGDWANVSIQAEANATDGEIGSVTVGNITLVATGTSTASVTVDVDAFALGALNLGNVDISSSVSSSVDVNIMTTAALGTDADIVIDAFTLRGSGAYQFDVGFATYTGDITINSVVVDVSATATGMYDLTGALLAGVMTTGDVTLGTIDYSGYALTGTSTTGAVIDISGFAGDIVVIGSDLDDMITDNAEINTLTGGDGADVFSFVAMDANGDGLTAANADVITDFEHGVDIIELDTSTSFSAAEYYEGTASTFAAFLTLATTQMTSSPEDNLVAVQVGDDVYLAIDYNDGDSVDAVIKLTGVTTSSLNFADFDFV